MTGESGSATAYRTPKGGKKYFTLAEANRALPYVIGIVNDITECYQYAVQIRQQIEQPDPDQARNDLKDQYELTMDRLNALIDELQQVGVELKDFERGLLDFPAIYDGREIYLCWHRGEVKIQAWHEIDAGYTGRQNVELLSHSP